MASTGFLSVDAVSVSFGGLAALTDLSFNMRQGQIKGLIGPNGAGKSTLFNVVAGLLMPAAGAVRFRDQEIQGLPSHRRVKVGIARTFQNLQIFKDLTVLENVMVGCHARFRSGIWASVLRTPHQRIEEAQIRATAHEKLDLLGLGGKAHLLAADLSFGEAKILEIARALATDPALILLDEPVAGVPHAEVAHVVQVIRDINKDGVSVLLVEHNMGFVMQLCDDIVVLNYGRKIAEGDAATVRCDPEVLRAYLGEDAVDA
ncbi:MAG: ABC transporter ATP-binding protein [Candidimonas sp.]|nr:MAG: ABC transporter ATP-binding protein [Candidimonas sp.]TAM25158.1 MAG: ABC transporter ATP-binding protein [Candidimonas sp.]